MPLDAIGGLFGTKEIKRPEERAPEYAQQTPPAFVNSIFTQLNGGSVSTSCQG